MSRRVLVIKASPREKGNSSVLANRVMDGAGEVGATTESVSLHRLDIRPCRGCDTCRATHACVIKDDMQGLYPKLLAAEAIVLASPIYWFTFSGGMKTFIDRWYALWNIAKEPFKAKPVGIVLSYGDTDPYTSGCINAIHTFESIFRFLEAPIADWVYGLAMEIGDVQKNPALLDSARSLGRQLGTA